jgi:DNA-binding MarR family transcriptional regulator
MSIKGLLFNELGTVFADEGLNSTELMIIYLLQHKRQEFRAGDLATALCLPMSTLTGIIDKMIKKGLVIRKHGEEDRRVVIIEMNPKYRQRSQNYMADLVKLVQEISESFSPEWFNDFNEKLKTFKEVLEKRIR